MPVDLYSRVLISRSTRITHKTPERPIRIVIVFSSGREAKEIPQPLAKRTGAISTPIMMTVMTIVNGLLFVVCPVSWKGKYTMIRKETYHNYGGGLHSDGSREVMMSAISITTTMRWLICSWLLNVVIIAEGMMSMPVAMAIIMMWAWILIDGLLVSVWPLGWIVAHHPSHWMWEGIRNSIISRALPRAHTVNNNANNSQLTDSSS